MKKTPRGKHQTMWNKINNGCFVILEYFVSVAFLLFWVGIAIHFHKSVLGIYKLEREMQQIHQRLDQKPPVDKNKSQNGAEIG
jgi:hypothetical protein